MNSTAVRSSRWKGGGEGSPLPACACVWSASMGLLFYTHKHNCFLSALHKVLPHANLLASKLDQIVYRGRMPSLTPPNTPVPGAHNVHCCPRAQCVGDARTQMLTIASLYHCARTRGGGCAA